jgi:hypothetical protein
MPILPLAILCILFKIHDILAKNRINRIASGRIGRIIANRVQV